MEKTGGDDRLPDDVYDYCFDPVTRPVLLRTSGSMPLGSCRCSVNGEGERAVSYWEGRYRKGMTIGEKTDVGCPHAMSDLSMSCLSIEPPKPTAAFRRSLTHRVVCFSTRVLNEDSSLSI